MKKQILCFVIPEILKDEMVSKFRRLDESKFVYLSNGYDKAAFNVLLKKDKYKKFTISYTGTLYLGRSPEPIFKALKVIQKTSEYDINNIQLLLVGNCSLIDGMRTSDLISLYNLESVVKVSGPVPHNQSLEVICRSHLALLLAPDQPFQIPGKVFEYIGAGTKILAISGKGATADLINEYGFGKVFAPEDLVGIKSFIIKAIEEVNLLKPWNNNRFTVVFNHKNIVKKLAEHLNGFRYNVK